MHAWQTLFSWVNFHSTFLSNFPKFPSKLFEIQKISCYIVKRICWFALRVHIFVGNIWSQSINLSSVSLKLVMLMWIGNLKSNSISIHTSHVHTNDHLLLLYLFYTFSSFRTTKSLVFMDKQNCFNPLKKTCGICRTSGK